MGKITNEVSPPDATPIPPPKLSSYSRLGVCCRTFFAALNMLAICMTHLLWAGSFVVFILLVKLRFSADDDATLFQRTVLVYVYTGIVSLVGIVGAIRAAHPYRFGLCYNNLSSDERVKVRDNHKQCWCCMTLKEYKYAEYHYYGGGCYAFCCRGTYLFTWSSIGSPLVLLVTGPMHYFTILGIGINDFYSGDLHVAFWIWFGVYAVVWIIVFLVSIASLIAYRRSTRELEEKMQQQQELAKCTNPVFRSDVV